MAVTETSNKPAARDVPVALKQDAQNRRVISTKIKAPTAAAAPAAAGDAVPASASGASEVGGARAEIVQKKTVDDVKNLPRELFVQCMYMVPGVGNAMSLYDVGVDIYVLATEEGAMTSPMRWGVLAIDAIGVLPAAGNITRAPRAIIKEVLLAFIKGETIQVLLELIWARWGGNALEWLATLEKEMNELQADLDDVIVKACDTISKFVANPVAAAQPLDHVNDGFLSWVPSAETIVLYNIEALLKASGQQARILAAIEEFKRNRGVMLKKAFGTAKEAASLLGIASQIVAAAKLHGKPSFSGGKGAGRATEPHRKSGEHRDTTHMGADASKVPTKRGCGCPETASDKPINYALGDEHLDQTDFTLDGVTPIVWTRSYRSSLAAYNDSPLGARWTSPYHLSLEERDGGLTFFDPDARAVPLPKVDIGETVHVPTEQLTVIRPDRRMVRLVYPDGSREDYQLHGTGASLRYRLSARIGRDGLGLNFTYNEAGELVTISDGAENHLRLDYENGRLAAIYRTGIAGIASEAIARYTYSPEGDLIEHQDVLGHTRTYAYTQHLLTRYTDFNGNAANLEWSWPGQHSGAPAPADARCVRTWLGDAADTETDRRPDVREDTRFEYHRELWYTKVTDADGKETIHRYDYHNRIILVEHPDGTSDAFDWNDSNQLISTKNALGQTQHFEYDAEGRVSAVTDALSMTTRTEYNADGLPVKITDANGDTTETSYDALGRPVSVTDSAGRTTRYAWNGNGRLLSLTDPKGGVKRFRYDNAGRLSESADCSGNATHFGYDERGYLSGVTDAEGNETRYRRDARGQIIAIGRADGVEERFTWDGNGNLKTYRDGAGQTTEYSYTPLDQISRRSVIDRNATNHHERWNHSVAYDYDKLGRLTTLTNENRDTTTFRYDALGQLIEEKGFDGRTVAYEYDDAGRLVVSRESDIETKYERDPLGRLTKREVQGHGAERFHYDARGRLVTAKASGSTVRLHYDDADNLIAEEQAIRPGEGEYLTVTRHEYDALGNRTKTILPNTRTIDWLRYGSGHVHGVMLDGKPLIDFERDKLHREIGRTHRSFTQTRGYDRVGRLSQMSVRHASASNLADEIAGRKYQYSAAGHLTRIDDRMRGGTDYTYDPVGRLLSSVTADLKEVFSYDFAGNRVDPDKVAPRPVVETPEAAATRLAAEHAEDEAWERAHPGEIRRSRQNRRGSEDSEKIIAWQRALPKCIGNVLRELDRAEFEYDARGNLIGKIEGGVSWEYKYDGSNRLREARRYAKTGPERGADQGRGIKPAPDLAVNFEYDTFGRRVHKRVQRASGPAESTFFTWDGDVLLMEERFKALSRGVGRERQSANHGFEVVREDPSDAYSLPVAQRMHTLDGGYQWMRASLYLHEPGSFVPLARLDERLVEPAFLATGTDGQFVQVAAKSKHATVFYANDHLGTPQEILDESGKVVWLARYKAWGKLKRAPYGKTDPAETDNAIRFQGQYFDEETGLHYNRHRYYDPSTGRYISKDPIGLAGGLNAYMYAPNPVGWVDPLGLSAASDLPRVKGRSVSRVESTLRNGGFNKTKDNGVNQTWKHADGSEVRVHKYGNKCPCPFKSGNNAHVHKEDPSGNQLNDRGIVSVDPNETHIGIRNPADLPTVRGRPHGS